MRWVFVLVLMASVVRAQESRTPEPDSASPEVRAFLAECSQAWDDVRTLRVRFQQTKELVILRRPRRSQGTIWVKDGRVLMRVANEKGDVEMVLGVDRGEARMYYPKLARVEVYALGAKAQAPTPFPLFSNDLTALPADYRIELRRIEDEVELDLVPKDEESAIRKVTMRFHDRRVRRMEQVNVNGDKVVLSIETYEPNVEVREEDVRLVVLEGTEVVRVLGRDRGATK